jgi:hypothetical protein
MACAGRYAAAWEFSAFWCTAGYLHRVDNGGGAGIAFLTDTQTDFLAAGVQAGVGMVLYNLTDLSSGPVTAVDENHITATLVGGSGNHWHNGDEYRIVTITAQEIAVIEHYLDIAASDIHAALAAAGACDCATASWADEYLKKLNIIDAAAYYRCPCGQPQLSDEMRTAYLEWMSEQLRLLRTGEQDICDGATGAMYPSSAWAEHSFTDMNAAKIIVNRMRRTL